VKIVLQTSKESDLKATNQEQTEEKYVTNDSNRSANPRKRGSFDVTQSIFTTIQARRRALRFETSFIDARIASTNLESYTSTRKRSRKAISANANR
jgi:hypothetical protein